MKSLSLLLLLLVALCLQSTTGFHEGVGRVNIPRRGTAGLDAWELSKDESGRSLHHRAVTALFASRQFRNVEEMLETFREDFVLINFMAVNCGPCRLQKKELASVSRAVGSDLHMLAIDTNRWPSVSSRFEVGKLPCLVAMKNGEVLFRIEGYAKAEDVVARVRSLQQRQYHH